MEVVFGKSFGKAKDTGKNKGKGIQPPILLE